jgi:hypothetical protein
MIFDYSLNNGGLIIKDKSKDLIVWQGKPLDHVVEKILVHPERNVCFAIFPFEEAPRVYPEGPREEFNKLVCINPQGQVLWAADLLASGVDFYTNILWPIDLKTEIFKITLQVEESSLITLSYSGFFSKCKSRERKN